jgi:hypothetical protein
MPAWIGSLLDFLSTLLGFTSKQEDIQAGVDKQTSADALAAVKTDTAQAKSAANAPQTKAELEAELRKGKV